MSKNDKKVGANDWQKILAGNSRTTKSAKTEPKKPTEKFKPLCKSNPTRRNEGCRPSKPPCHK